ncbi:MAG: hypothetical protein LH480_10700 [Rubrivivax sp.]|nr:hypothetical protein [Rubrivivax sp.]
MNGLGTSDWSSGLGETAHEILDGLQQVAAERDVRAAEPALAERVMAVKCHQHARFAQTYADLAAQPRYREATRFFLDELYGPGDFSSRDAQFARIVPALVRLFPREIVATVADLSTLHALSEQLDTAMARTLNVDAMPAAAYAAAWRAVGQPAQRERQIRLMLAVGESLDRHTRSPLLRNSLRLMRRPAEAAGLGALQRFLESGFSSFRAMNGAAEFLGLVAERERSLAQHLFGGGDVNSPGGGVS